MAAKTGIVEEGMAVGCGNVAEALERTTKTDLLVVAHYLYVCSLVETKDDAAALLLDELLATAAADVTELLLSARQSELTGYHTDGFLVKACALGHLLIAKVGVFHQNEGAGIAVASRRTALPQSEPTGVAADCAARTADM